MNFLEQYTWEIFSGILFSMLVFMLWRLELAYIEKNQWKDAFNNLERLIK